MNSVFLFSLVTLALLGALYWLSRRMSTDRGAAHLLETLSAEDLLPHHYKYFPQIRQALSPEDGRFLGTRANAATRRLARRARRHSALRFMEGLREDYNRLDRLARTLTALAPSASSQREIERVFLFVRFNFLWTLVWMSLWTGATPIVQLRSLADLIGSLAARLETSMAALQTATSAAGLKTS